MDPQEKKDSLPEPKPAAKAPEPKPVDIKDILLPKKQGAPSVDSAQRINAGALLEQEQKAAVAGLNPQLDATGVASAPKPAAPETPTPKKEESMVQPLQTYKSDVESLVQSKNVSVVSIAAAEAGRRAEAAKAAPPPQTAADHPWRGRVVLIAGGILLLSAGAGLVAFLAMRPTTVPVVPLQTTAPFITVDDTVQVPVPAGTSRSSLVQTLDAARQNVKLSLGLMARIELTSPGTDAAGNPTLTELPSQTLLTTLAPYIPGTLTRTLTGQYLLGVHSFDNNDAFLIVSTDSYETAYAGMLQWENTMQADLSPLFDRKPPVHANSDATATPTAIVGTSTATSTTPGGYFGQGGTSTPQAAPLAFVSPAAFVDRVVENHDARVIQNSYGDILLLWTFLDRNTIAITNNEYTLREIISRINEPAVQTLIQ